MEVVSHLYGGAPVIQRLPVGATASRIGVPWLAPAANTNGLAIGTVTSLDLFLGINLDTTDTYVTAQQSNDVEPEQTIALDIRPDQVIRIKLSGGATDNTALTLRTVLTANSDGLTVTTASGDNWASPEMDEGTIWYYDGANAGKQRGITTTSSNVATVIVAFRLDDVANDRVSYAPVYAYRANTITLTTNLTQFRQDSAVATNTGSFICTDTSELRGLADSGSTDSHARFISGNHVARIAT